uniref:Uncharacterized protein n=1 Tax=Parascaris equorum TaxID=6256 RepID=A0A914S2V2_PAREQ
SVARERGACGWFGEAWCGSFTLVSPAKVFRALKFVMATLLDLNPSSVVCGGAFRLFKRSMGGDCIASVVII